ncbi:MAG TPA: YihY/virulence factor BrkB family protein [Cyclobacteriaceae bacterium]|nr:YihY/virulence factor BrkB family protein [Cyclobacteriaceae bacterium]
MSFIKNFASLLVNTFKQWIDRDPFNNSIIIAYYTIFSLPGLLVIIINIAGYFYDKSVVTTDITNEIQAMIGGDTAKDVQAIIIKATEHKGNVIASILGVATLIFGATGVFYQLQQMLNKIWETEPKAKSTKKIIVLIMNRLFSLGLVLALGFLMLVSLVISTVLNALGNWVTNHMSLSFDIIFKVMDILISIGAITLLFASIFKFLPDTKIRWKNVWPGSLLTAVLFVIAQYLLGLYFGKSNPGTTYGAAGSIVLIMLWVSYTGMILLFGAEFTHEYNIYCNKRNSKNVTD